MPLRTGEVKVKAQTLLGIFSNVDILYSIHCELLKELQRMSPEKPQIGAVFIKAVSIHEIKP